jgi:hypothetical protein
MVGEAATALPLFLLLLLVVVVVVVVEEPLILRLLAINAVRKVIMPVIAKINLQQRQEPTPASNLQAAAVEVAQVPVSSAEKRGIGLVIAPILKEVLLYV